MAKDREDLHRMLTAATYARTLLWCIAVVLLHAVAGLNSLWFFPGFVQRDGAAGIIGVSFVGVVVFGVLVGNAIACGAWARQIGHRLLKDFNDDSYFNCR